MYYTVASKAKRYKSYNFNPLKSRVFSMFGNFGRNMNGAPRSRWKSSGKSGPPSEVFLFDRSVQSDQKLPFLFQTFSFPVIFHRKEIEISVER